MPAFSYFIGLRRAGSSPRGCRVSGVSALLIGAMVTAAAMVPGSRALGAVYLEDSPDAVQRARQAQEHLEAGRPGEAAALLQSLRMEFGTRLMEREPGHYVDGARWVGLRLLDESVLRAAYRQRFDAAALRARHASHRAQDPRAALAAVAGRYAGSGPGRDAALDLAARHIRAGQGLAACDELNDLAALPEFTGQGDASLSMDTDAAKRFWTLSAWSAALVNDAAAREAALNQVAALSGPELAAELAAQLTGPPRPATDSAAAEADPRAAPGPSPQPLWRVTLSEPEPAPDDTGTYRAYTATRATPTSPLGTVAHGELILANDTQRVYALDAVSGRMRWSHALPVPPAADAPQELWRGGAVQTLPDARTVAATAHRPYAFAVLGAVRTLRGRQGLNPPAPLSVLVCLDTKRGQALWSVRPSDVDAVVARASFHGTPLLTDDLVIVAARRSQVSSFEDSYLVAFDRATGALRWRRHVASTQGPQARRAGIALSSMSLSADRRRVYFCDNLGAAAALDAPTGAVRWLRVFASKDAATSSTHPGFAPLSAGAAPVAVRGGVLLPVQHGPDVGLLLEADTGRTRVSLSATSSLAGMARLQALPGGDLLVSTLHGVVHRLHGEDLTPAWTHPDGGTDMALAGERVWLLDAEGRLTGLDLQSGDIRYAATLAHPGALVAVEHGLVTVTRRSLASYTPWSAAYATLQERADQQPHAPEIGLSMATLALNAASVPAANASHPPVPTAQAVLRGINHTLQSLDAPVKTVEPADREQRAHTLDTLLSLTDRAAGTLDPHDVDRIFDRIAGAARSPHELLSYTLARASAAATQDRPTQAADLYQAVLGNDALSSERIHRHGVARRGGVVARQALQDLVARSGRGVYAPHARRAAMALKQLNQGVVDDPEPYLALAHRYPLGAAAAQALLRAGQLQSEGHIPAAAATTLRRSHSLSVDDAGRSAAAAALATHYLSQDRPAAAVRWLIQVHRDSPSLLLTTPDGRQISAAAWAATLADDAPSAAISRLHFPLGPARTEPGQRLAQATASVPSHRVLLRGPQAGRLAFHSPALQGPAQWSVKDDPHDHVLINLNADSAVLWSPRAGRVTVRATADGREIFPAVAVESLLSELGVGGRVAAARRAAAGASIELIESDFSRPAYAARENQARLRAARDTPPMVDAGESTIAVVDAVGRAAAFDRYTGIALWHQELPIEAVAWTRVADGLLLIGGLRGAGTGAESGVVQVLDLTTGRPHLQDLEAPDAARWAGISPNGEVLVLRPTELSAHAPGTGAVRWRAAFSPLDAGLTDVRLLGNTLIATDGARIVTVNLEQGAVIGQTTALAAGSRLHTVGDRLLLDHDRAGLTALTREGRTAWRSAAALIPGGRISVVLLDGSALVATASSDDSDATVELFRLDLDTGRIMDRQLTTVPAGLLGPGRMAVVNNTLLLTSRQKTHILPGAASPR